ncbi:hypothetical protein COT40_01530 [Candidatus Peregrinibacteria bacterium CG08_land_8_20_14_0_20_41_10]|nr:MAG: hypothetical protein COT40_01530 [Candidatus Peregrinibacteria bacterium CG08_land_8_20_14_0_20_41_10]
MTKTTDPQNPMQELLKLTPVFKVPALGALIEGAIVEIVKNRIVVDLGGNLTGVVAGKEIHDEKKTALDLKIGDKIKAVVIMEENEDGLVVLSLRKAAQLNSWDNALKMFEESVTFQVKILEANKGGLLTEAGGLKAFIPVSQLSPVHYPRVEGGNLNRILDKLNAIVGKLLTVKVIGLDAENRKLVLSEKEALSEERDQTLSGLKVGQKVKGTISSIVSYGVFVAFNGLEGLVHISEIAWGHVSDPRQYAKIGDEVEVLIIGLDRGKISLSMKQLRPDPWVEIAQKYKLGDVVESKITRLTPFGVFVQMEGDINGLVHLSEISHKIVRDPADFVKVGQIIKTKIINLDLEEHRIGLSIKALIPNPKEQVTEEPKKPETEKPKENKTEEPEDKTTKEQINTGAEKQSTEEKEAKTKKTPKKTVAKKKTEEPKDEGTKEQKVKKKEPKAKKITKKEK